jgi:sulfide:quinone oxidoreductase
MTNADTARPIHVVIAGAGVAGLEALIALRELAGDRVTISLVSPEDHFVYRPLSVGDPFALGSALRIPVRDISREFRAEHVGDGMAAVDPDRHVVKLEGGDEISYDKLIVATGSARVPVFDRATTFRGQEDVEALHGLVKDVEGGYAKRIAFIVPTGVAWSLPLYELALMTAERAYSMSVDVEITFVTPEETPLVIFGSNASAEVAELLERAGIDVHCSTAAEVSAKGTVILHPGGESMNFDRIVALPIVKADPIAGLPSDAEGFIPVDSFARVGGVADVYAAGDRTNFPLKQGGIACQQADAAASHIAREAGMPIEVETFRPVLRGQLLTGGKPHFMRRDVSGRVGQAEASGEHMLWWPPSKVAGKRLAPYLAARDKSSQAVLEGAETVELHGFEFASR